MWITILITYGVLATLWSVLYYLTNKKEWKQADKDRRECLSLCKEHEEKAGKYKEDAGKQELRANQYQAEADRYKADANEALTELAEYKKSYFQLVEDRDYYRDKVKLYESI